MRKFLVKNFGCKVNQEEGGALAALFMHEGWEIFPDDADNTDNTDNSAPELIIVNTCTVTAIADKKCRNIIRRLRQQYPTAVMAVCGCYAQRDGAGIAALDCADIIVGVAERRLLPQLVKDFLEHQTPIQQISDIAQEENFHIIYEHSAQARARAYLKVEDGCDQFCNYCIIPHVRGPVRSLPPEDAVRQARKLAEAGHGEIVITGIHVGAYYDKDSHTDLAGLLKLLLAELPETRLRLGSVEPQQFTANLLRLIEKEERLCPHLHIPLQSGCDKILAAMGRHYTTAQYAALLDNISHLRENIAFTTDIITGYPGETETDFETTLQFVKKLPLADMHIFPFSPRSGTPAATALKQVPTKIKESRARRLNEEAEKHHAAFVARNLGKKLMMLAEEYVSVAGQTYLRGHSENYLELLLPVETPAETTTPKTKNFLEVEIIGLQGKNVLCRQIDKQAIAEI